MRIVVLALLVAGMAVPLVAADWPQFRGPGGTGISTETGLARTWPADGPRVRWRVPVSQGFATPAVRDGKVYLMERDETRGAAKDILRVLDLATGQEAWRFENPTWRTLDSYPGSRTTPLVDDRYVYFMGVIGDYYCLDKTTHEVVWHHYLSKEFANQSPRWGNAQSPVIANDLAIAAVLSPTVGLVAYDRVTGELKWQTPFIGRGIFSFMTPYVTTLCGVPQVVTIANADTSGLAAVASGVELASGKVLWRIRLWRHYNLPISQPVKTADDTLFVAGGYRIGCFTLKVTRSDDNWSVGYGFKDNTNCTPLVHAPILYQDHLYAQSADHPHNNPERDAREREGRTLVNHGLECLDLQGNILWETGKDDDLNCGGLLIADGLLYAMDGNTGELRMVEATPAGYKELGRTTVLQPKVRSIMDAGAWGELTLADGLLLCRDDQQLVCLDVRQP